jgi:hypothetical protein
MPIAKGLIIDTPHIDRILSGAKTWELRSSHTKIRGRVALIRKGSGQVVGTAEIIDSLGPMSDTDMLQNIAKHMVEEARLKEGKLSKYRYAWVLANPRRLAKPVPYAHPNGAVIWVNLAPEVSAQLTG